MERELLLTGVGGQGVQLASQVLGRAALAECREVMVLGTYGGTMRGGSTDSCVVAADEPIRTPPIVSRAWAAMVARVKRKASAPYSAVTSRGSMTLPLVLDIFWPASSRTMPWR